MKSFAEYFEEATRREFVSGAGAALGMPRTVAGTAKKVLGTAAKKWLVVQFDLDDAIWDVEHADAKDMQGLQNPKGGIRPQVSDDGDIIIDMDSQFIRMKVFFKPGGKTYNEWSKMYKNLENPNNLDNVTDLYDLDDGFDVNNIDIRGITRKYLDTAFKNTKWVEKQLNLFITNIMEHGDIHWKGKEIFVTPGHAIEDAVRGLTDKYNSYDGSYELPNNIKTLFKKYLDKALKFAKNIEDKKSREELENEIKKDIAEIEGDTEQAPYSSLGSYVGPRMQPVPDFAVEEATRRDVIKGIGAAVSMPKMPLSLDKQSMQKPMYLQFGWDFEIVEYGEATQDILKSIQSPKKFRPVMSDNKDMVVDMDNMSPVNMRVVVLPGTGLHNDLITTISNAESKTNDRASVRRLLDQNFGRGGLELQDKIVNIYIKNAQWIEDQISRMTKWSHEYLQEDGDAVYKSAFTGIQVLRDLIETNNGNRSKKRKLPPNIISILKSKYKKIQKLAKAAGDSESHQDSEQEIKELENSNNKTSQSPYSSLGSYVGPRMQPVPDFAAESFKQFYFENFKDGKKKGKSRPGRVKRSGASCKGSVTSLRAKAKKYGGEKGKMYHWCANMKGGKKK